MRPFVKVSDTRLLVEFSHVLLNRLPPKKLLPESRLANPFAQAECMIAPWFQRTIPVPRHEYFWVLESQAIEFSCPSILSGAGGWAVFDAVLPSYIGGLQEFEKDSFVALGINGH